MLTDLHDAQAGLQNIKKNQKLTLLLLYTSGSDSYCSVVRKENRRSKLTQRGDILDHAVPLPPSISVSYVQC